jgi:hypothetical protein
MIIIKVDTYTFYLPEDLPYSIIEEQVVNKKLWKLYPDGEKELTLIDPRHTEKEPVKIKLCDLFEKPDKN